MGDKKSVTGAIKRRFVKDKSGILIPPSVMVERAQERVSSVPSVVRGAKGLSGRYKTPKGRFWTRGKGRRLRPLMERQHGKYSPGLEHHLRTDTIRQQRRKTVRAQRRARAVNRGR